MAGLSTAMDYLKSQISEPSIAKQAKKNDVSLSPKDEAKLLAKLKLYSRLSRAGESKRRDIDNKGAKLRAGKHFDKGLPAGTTGIISNKATALYEQHLYSTTRNKPIPNITPKSDDDTEGAALIQGALLQNWEDTNMTGKLKQAALKAGFGRPCLLFVQWDNEALNGIGNINTHIIDGYRSIIDNDYAEINEMLYVGIRKKLTRAKAIMQFPGKAKDIEEAGSAINNLEGGLVNPLDVDDGPKQQDLKNGNLYQPQITAYGVSGTAAPMDGNKPIDPLSKEIEIEFMWINDPTPKLRKKVKLNELGRQVKRLVRKENGEIDFDIKTWNVVQTPFGPMYQPDLQPKTEIVYEEVLEKKYLHRRFVAWIPQDNIILWDKDWLGPIPLVDVRDNIALNGYWTEGLALRLCDLQAARNIIHTIILQKIKLSMAGIILASLRSQLKGDRLIPRPGMVISLPAISEQDVRVLPTETMDPMLGQYLSMIDSEMAQLLGISPVSQGQAAGRAESPETYNVLLEQGSGSAAEIGQLMERSVRQWCIIAMWFIQNYYTHRHFVEIEDEEGAVHFKAASALTTRGEFAVKIEERSMSSYSENAQWLRMKEYYSMGVYTLPGLAKYAKVPHWREQMKQKLMLMKNPLLAPLLGAAAASPTQQSRAATAKPKRTTSHHSPVTGK